MLRGLHDTKVPMIWPRSATGASGCRSAWCSPFISASPAVGIWMGLSTGLAVVSVLLLWRWLRRAELGLTTPRDSIAP